MEDKSNLAFLQLRMKAPMLDTFIASNAEKALHWCSARWTQTEASSEKSSMKSWAPQACLASASFLNEPHHWSVPFENLSEADILAMDLSDWWALKASKGNGGRDVWVINRHNYAAVFDTVPLRDEYIIQRWAVKMLGNKKEVIVWVVNMSMCWWRSRVKGLTGGV